MTLTNTAMQPSSKAAQSVSAAAEALFETKTVSEIRQAHMIVLLLKGATAPTPNQLLVISECCSAFADRGEDQEGYRWEEPEAQAACWRFPQASNHPLVPGPGLVCGQAAG